MYREQDGVSMAPEWSYPPDEVIIGPHAYRVEPITDPAAGLGRLAHPDNVGHTNITRGRLSYRADGTLSLSQVRDTVLHEVIHAIMSQAQVDAETDVFKTDRMAERVVDVTATGLLDVLRRNPTLLRFLVGDLDDHEAQHRAEVARWNDLYQRVAEVDAKPIGPDGSAGQHAAKQAIQKIVADMRREAGYDR